MEIPCSAATIMRILSASLERNRMIVTRNDMVNYMANVLLGLPEKCRDVMNHRYYNELSYADIAEILDTTEENARQIARRTRKMLAKKLTEQGVTL